MRGKERRSRVLLGISDAADEMDAAVGARHLREYLCKDLVLLERTVLDFLVDAHHVAVLSLSRTDHESADARITGLAFRETHLHSKEGTGPTRSPFASSS